MAKITQASISLELNVIHVEHISEGISVITLTIEEARDLMNLLKERFSENTVEPAWSHYPEGVRGFKMTPTDAFANPGGNDPLAGTTTLEYPPGVR